MIPQILHLPTIDYSINIDSKDNAIAFYNYDNTMYSPIERYPVKVMSQTIGYVALSMMVIGLFFPIGKLIVIECLAVIQLGYFSVIQLVKISPNY